MNRFRSPFILLAFLLLLGIPRPLPAATLTVTSLDDSGAGTLRDAIGSANAGDTIVFASGLSGTITLASTLDVTVSLSISGPGADLITLSGNNTANNIFSIQGAGNDFTVSGLTLSGALFTGVDTQSNLDIMNCNINDHGGRGIVVESADLTLASSIVSGNNGGIFAEINSNLTITDSTIADNISTSSGGAISLDSSMASLNSSTLSGNQGVNEGGGVYLTNGSTLNLTNVTVSGNTVVINDANGFRGGGGINNLGSTVNLFNTTLSNNTVSGIMNMTQGGGGVLDNWGSTTLQNTIIAQNNASAPGTGVDCFGTLSSNGFNLIGIGGAGTGCFGFTDGVNSDQVGSDGNPLDPNLNDLGDFGGPVQTQTLMEGSPAVDAGTNTGCPPEDTRGTTRPLDGLGDGGTPTCDIGAVEAGRVDLILQSGSSLDNLKLQGLDPGVPIDFSATLKNQGPDYAPGVSLSATMPAGITLLAAGAGNQDCFQSSTELQCDLGSIQPDSTLAVALTLQVDSADPATYRIPITANTTGEDDAGDNTLTFLVSVGEPATGGGGGCGCGLEAAPQSLRGGMILATLLGLTGFIWRFYRRNPPFNLS